MQNIKKNAKTLKIRFFVTFGAAQYATVLYLWPMPAYLRGINIQCYKIKMELKKM